MRGQDHLPRPCYIELVQAVHFLNPQPFVRVHDKVGGLSIPFISDREPQQGLITNSGHQPERLCGSGIWGFP